MSLIPNVERIAVLRSNGIGDLIMALPALEAVRAAYPRAHVTLLARPWHDELLEGRPGPIDEVVLVPPWKGVGDEEGDEDGLAEGFFENMRARRFDLALQLHGGGANSNPFVKRLGASVTVGMRTPDAPPLDRDIPYIYYQSEVMRLLEAVSLVGAAPVTLEPWLQVTEKDRQEASEYLEREGYSGERPLVALNPGAGDTRRRWPKERFAELGDALAEAGNRIVLTGGEGDLSLAGAIAGRMKSAPLSAAGRLSLGGTAGLYERCRLVVSNDSGPMHLAAAVGAPTVAIFWCGNLINAGPLFRSRQRPLISWRLECPVCGVDCTKGECDHGESFVADVPFDEVKRAAFELLDAPPRNRTTVTAPRDLAPTAARDEQVGSRKE